MSTTTTERRLKLVDLIRQRPYKWITIPAFPVEVIIEVTTSARIGKPAPAPSAVFDRLEGVAREVLDRYETVIGEECVKLDAKIGALAGAKDPAEWKKASAMIEGTNTMVKQALLGATPAAQKAVEDRLRQEAHGDSLLQEARVKTAVQVTVAVISVAGSVGKLVGTAGADLQSYVSIAEKLYDLWKELQQQLKNHEQLRDELESAVKKLIAHSDFAIKARNIAGHGVLGAQKALSAAAVLGFKLPSFVSDAANVALDEIADRLKETENARVKYRNHTYKMRQQADALSSQADNLLHAMREAKNLKDGVKLGADCMSVKRNVRQMLVDLRTAEDFLADLETALRSRGGIRLDDRTVLEKLRSFKKMTIMTTGGSVYSDFMEIYEAVNDIREALN